MRSLLCPLVGALTIFLGLAAPVWSEEKNLVVLDGSGQEIQLKTWKFLTGTRHLSWLGDQVDPLQKKGDKVTAVPRGPECLEFREDKVPAYANDITVFIPLSGLSKIDYDHDKKTIAVTVLAAGDKERTLVGPGKFVNINKFNIDGTSIPGKVTVAGDVKFQDGVLKAPIKSFRFPQPQALSEPSGRPAVVIAQDKAKTVHPVMDLIPIYKVGFELKAIPTLVFQKAGNIELAKVTKMVNQPSQERQGYTLDFEVTQVDGSKLSLTLLEKTTLEEKQNAVLWGLVGKVSEGFKLFPAHTIAELRFEEKKESPK